MTQEIHLPFDVELSPVTILKAGELTCMYELGKLRYIRRGNSELIRMIYSAVRNEHWGTLPYSIEDEQLSIQNESFSIQYTAVYRQQAAVYKAYFNIEGKPDNTITFSMKGEALAAFQKNRIGLCVHHPIKECGGQTVMITRPDRSVYQSTFPQMVSPRQPFHDIQQMKWSTGDNTDVQLFFEGDIFETEDQRNWSDSSYKTYSTPLHIPFPVNIQQGDTMQQKISLVACNNTGDTEQATENIREEKISFPKIGYSRSVNQARLTPAEIFFLQKIPFYHYRIMLLMDEAAWEQELDAALTEALQLNTALELVVFFSDQFNDEIRRLLPVLGKKQQLLYSILVLQKNHPVSPQDLLSQVYPLVKEMLPAIQIGYGTDLNFVDLNRQQPVDTIFDFVSYSLHPQAHMVDNRSILENLDNQPDMIATAKSFASGKPVFVSPVTLKDRYDLAGPDERQYIAMAAWWTLMSIQQLAMAGSITFYELFGESGLLRVNKNQKGETVSIQPSLVYEMLAAIHNFQPLWIIKRYAARNVVPDGLLLENAKGGRLFFKAPEQYLGFKYQ
jgi:D-apionolactonase